MNGVVFQESTLTLLCFQMGKNLSFSEGLLVNIANSILYLYLYLNVTHFLYMSLLRNRLISIKNTSMPKRGMAKIKYIRNTFNMISITFSSTISFQEYLFIQFPDPGFDADDQVDTEETIKNEKRIILQVDLEIRWSAREEIIPCKSKYECRKYKVKKRRVGFPGINFVKFP